MSYRSAIVGCGPRGKHHAEVYAEIPNMDLVACCDLDSSRREAFAKVFSIPTTYAGVDEMVAKERLYVVHLITQPDMRLDVITSAAEAGVPAVIVEKPLTLWPSEAVKIEELAARTGCKVIVNTQRRYFPQYPAIRDLIRSGRLGEVAFVRASTWGGPLAMGPHLLDLVMMVLDDEQPEAVWASAEGLEGYEWSHAAPSHVMATFWFPSNRRVFWECSPRSLGTRGESEYWMHLHLDIWCTEGVIWAEQVGTWGYQIRGEAEVFSRPASWWDQSVPGQRDFTAAVADWLDDPSKPHECRLETALPVMRSIFGALKSAKLGYRISLQGDEQFILDASQPGRTVTVPGGVTDNDLKSLRNNLTR